MESSPNLITSLARLRRKTGKQSRQQQDGGDDGDGHEANGDDDQGDL